MFTSLIAFFAATAAAGFPSLSARQNDNGTTGNDSVALKIPTMSGTRNATSPLLYGWMIEDISHSIDGGLYCELLQNRALQGVTGADNKLEPFAPTLEGYMPVGKGVNISLDAFHPLNDAITNALRVDVPAGATGPVGFMNMGWWGMQVIPQTYNASFYLQPAGYYSNITAVNISLVSNLTDDTWATHSFPLNNLTAFGYTKFFTQLKNEATAPNSNNSFTVTFDGAEAAGRSFYFTFNSLLSESFMDKPNGLRKDLGDIIYDLKPKFLRFPGGNNIEGQSYATRWIWNQTIGPVETRPGRPGDWGYWNTDGFGLLEFLEWNEAMGMEPLLAIYTGYSLDGVSVPEDQMGMVLQSALDELEYCMGDESTTWGARRIADGHPEPFQINYLELGNEDFFSATYPYRFPIMYKGIQEKYPNIQLISTTWNEPVEYPTYNYTLDLPPGIMYDVHHYDEPQFFASQFDYWDNWNANTNHTNVSILIGEYSVFQRDTNPHYVNYSDPVDLHVFYPELISALGEGVYLLAAERNPNIVKMSSYAPSFANLNLYNWTPNLVTFTANPKETILSVSYQLQKWFNAHHGTTTLDVSNTMGDFDPLYWAAAMDEPSGSVYLKVINMGNTTQQLTVDLDAAYSSVNGSKLANENIYGFNYLNNLTAIVPMPIDGLSVSASNNGTTFSYVVPASSVNIIEFNNGASGSGSTGTGTGTSTGSGASGTASPTTSSSSLPATAVAATTSWSGSFMIAAMVAAIVAALL